MAELTVTTTDGINEITSAETYYCFTTRTIDGVEVIDLDLQKNVGGGKAQTNAYIYGATTQEECITKATSKGFTLTPIEDGEDD